MDALKITAHLMSGFASNDRWSPAIDGIIAYAYMREVLGDEFAISQHRNDLQAPCDALPLEKVHWQAHWWYAASSPIYDEAEQHTRYLHRRFDAYTAEMYTKKKGKVQVQAGPYKNTRLPLAQHITGKIDWHVVGDRAKIERLLATVTHVGARCGAGFGRIRCWVITEGDAELARQYRPLPVGFPGHNPDAIIMQRGLVPPFRHPATQTVCVMP